MHATLLMMTALLTLNGPDARQTTTAAAAAPNQAHLVGCMVKLIQGDEIEVPAQEPGQLKSMEVKEGRDVEAGTLLGKIDDAQPQAQRKEREFELAVAKEQSENDVNLRFAKASLLVAEVELAQSLEANRKFPNTVTQTEVRRQKLNVEKVRLQIEQAEMEQRVNASTAGAKAARLQELDGIIERREIRAPISGRVVEVLKHRGEWVSPGDTVLKMVQLDKLRVDGFMNARDYSPEDVSNCVVKVKVRLAHGREEEFKGKIVNVDPRVQAGGEFRISAEVDNRMNVAQTDYLLRPGTLADMTVDVRGGAVKQAAGNRAPPANDFRVPPVRR